MLNKSGGVMSVLGKITFLSACMIQVLFGEWFVDDYSLENPPSLEENIESLLNVPCQDVDFLRGFVSNMQYKDDRASSECFREQRFLRSIVEDDLPTYAQMLEDGEGSKYFLFFTTYSPRLEITPLMVAVVFNAQKIFHFMLSDEQRDNLRPWIDKLIFDGFTSIGAFKLDGRIYNINGVSALDLSAMYHRYDMFWAMLQAKAQYGSPRNPQTNGIVTFGDPSILELMLYFDRQFLDKVGTESILHAVAREGNVDLVEYLIAQKRFNVDLLKSGETALDVALNGKNFQRKPQLEVVRKLIEFGAKVSEANGHRLRKLGVSVKGHEGNVW